MPHVSSRADRKKPMHEIRKTVKRPGDEFAAYLSGTKGSVEKHYIENRLLCQLNWYDQKSKRNKCCATMVLVFSIAASALIPFITLTLDMDILIYKLAVTAFGWGVTAVSSINAFCRFREMWIQYRTQCELLKSALHRFFTGCGEFKNSPEPLKLLVELCEKYMMKETSTWAATSPPKGQLPSTGS